MFLKRIRGLISYLRSTQSKHEIHEFEHKIQKLESYVDLDEDDPMYR